MTLVHEQPDRGDVTLLEQLRGGDGAHILGDDVSRAAACDGVELRFARFALALTVASRRPSRRTVTRSAIRKISSSRWVT